MSKFPANLEMFDALRGLNLPLGHYAVTGSGPLGIRDLRLMGDIDVIVDDEPWSSLASDHEVIESDGMVRIALNDVVDVVGAGSAFLSKNASDPSFAE